MDLNLGNIAKGVWTADTEVVFLAPAGYHCVVTDGNGTANVVAVCGKVGDSDEEMTIANCHAMSAAKDMLDLLPIARVLLTRAFAELPNMMPTTEQRQVIDAMDAAIGKGLGKPVEFVQAELDNTYTELMDEARERARIQAEAAEKP